MFSSWCQNQCLDRKNLEVLYNISTYATLSPWYNAHCQNLKVIYIYISLSLCHWGSLIDCMISNLTWNKKYPVLVNINQVHYQGNDK